MRKIGTILFIVTFFSSLFISTSWAGVKLSNEIAINVPAELITKLLNDALPIAIKKDHLFSGTVWVESIDRLTLRDNKISFFIEMKGDNIEYKSKLGETPLVLNLGHLRFAFECRAAIQFDRPGNILFILPEIVHEPDEKNVYVVLLATLINGQKFPIEIQKIDPIIADVGNNLLTVNMDISNINIMNDRLYIGIAPSLIKGPKKNAPVHSSR